MRKELRVIREQLKILKQTAEKFPDSQAYKKMVFDLQQQETDLVNQIGRKPKGKLKQAKDEGFSPIPRTGQ